MWKQNNNNSNKFCGHKYTHGECVSCLNVLNKIEAEQHTR